MPSRGWYLRPGLLVLTIVGACGKGDALILPSEGQAAKITLVRGNGQSGRVGEPLTDPVTVQVTDSKDRPVEGAEVSFQLTSSGQGADLVPKSSNTDADGMASTRVVLGTTIGPQTGQAQVVMAAGVQAPATTLYRDSTSRERQRYRRSGRRRIKAATPGRRSITSSSWK